MRHIVGVADMRLSSQAGDVIVTHGLGSCLGITVHDPVSSVGGLLHVMMPQASANPGKARANPCVFVDTGVPKFFGALQEAGALPRRWQVKVAGGGGVNGDNYFEIGKRNYVTFKRLLWKNGIFIDAEEIGGQLAKTLYMEIGSGLTWLSSNGRQWYF